MDDALRVEIAALFAADRAARERLWKIVQEHGPSSPAYEAARGPAEAAFEENAIGLAKIVGHHGWPGRSLVGEEASTQAFLLLQHADLATQLRFLPLVRQAAEAGEIPRKDLALLEDRVRIQQGLPQLYGSQFRFGVDGKPELAPIEDEARVDERRASVGLLPLAEYLRRAGLAQNVGTEPVQNPKF